jgi:hypothetical protein
MNSYMAVYKEYFTVYWNLHQTHLQEVGPSTSFVCHVADSPILHSWFDKNVTINCYYLCIKTLNYIFSVTSYLELHNAISISTYRRLIAGWV